jgi:two-component system chemotaxis response regulator CheY
MSIVAKVLVVDDSLFARKKLVQLLEREGYAVVEAANGEEAVALAAQETPEAVLMDITMPVLDGIQATQRIREQGLPCKVIMVSALGQKSSVLEAVKAGAVDYVLKPYEEERLLATLARHLG